MAAWTTVQFIRPSTPPALNGPILAEIAWEIANTGLIGHHVGQFVQLRYGKRIDADKIGTRETDYPWDAEQDVGAIDTVIRNLQVHPKPLYRANVGLGEIDDGVAEYLTRPAHPGSPTPMTLSTLGLEVGSIRVGSPHVQPVHVGWIAFTISGRGWPYPWSDQEFLARVRAIEAVEAVATMLDQRWPVTKPPGLFERLAWKKIANRMESAVPGAPSWIWAVSAT